MSLGKALDIKKEDWSDPEYCLTAVKQDGWDLEYVKNQTPELCLAAVKQNGHALEYVKNQTPEICLTAVKQNGCTLRYVKNQTPELCLEAVKQDGWALRYVKNQTPEFCLAAVRQSGCALQFVKEQTFEIIRAAFNQVPRAVNYINININILPISDWDVEWFKHIWDVELKRKFIKERGKEIFKELNPKVIQENDEYCLIEYYVGGDNTSKALLFRCPSSNDLYFQEIDPKIKTLKNALKFLNNNISKEQLAYES